MPSWTTIFLLVALIFFVLSTFGAKSPAWFSYLPAGLACVALALLYRVSQ